LADFSSSGLNVSTQRIHPPVFEVKVSPQTPVGVYTIPFVASVLISTINSTGSASTPYTAPVDTVTRVVDPEFQASKKYPTIGHIISPANLTIDVLPPPTFNETFMAVWDTYSTFIAIVASGMVGVLLTFIVEHRRSRREHKKI
jgi:hypothetical protein